MLTMKQEKFIQNIVKGMNQREAYKDAYNCKKMSDNAIDREACLLMKNPKVSQRHKELVDAIAIPSIMSAQERLEYLTSIVKNEVKEQGEVQADINTKIRAIDVMNKMTGEYTTKIEGSVSMKLEDLL